MTTQNKTIIESNNFIVLDKYVSQWQQSKHHQSEIDLENEFIDDLKNHKNITTTALGTIKVLSYLIIPISLPAYGAYRFLQKEKEEEGLKLISSLFAKQDDKEA